MRTLQNLHQRKINIVSPFVFFFSFSIFILVRTIISHQVVVTTPIFWSDNFTCFLLIIEIILKYFAWLQPLLSVLFLTSLFNTQHSKHALHFLLHLFPLLKMPLFPTSTSSNYSSPNANSSPPGRLF